MTEPNTEGLAPYYLIPASPVDDGAVYVVAVIDSSVSPLTKVGFVIKDRKTGETYYNGATFDELLGLLLYVRQYAPDVFEKANATEFEDVLGVRTLKPGDIEAAENGVRPTAEPPEPKEEPFKPGAILRLVDAEELGGATVGALAEVTGGPRLIYEQAHIPVKWIDSRASFESGRRQPDGYYLLDRFEPAVDLTEDDTMAIATYRLQGALG